MQPDYLARLAEPVQAFVREIEQSAGIAILVDLDPHLNGAGPSGLGHLAAAIEARRNVIFAPTNGYFPDGAVRHELLHLKRFHVDGVPKLALADAQAWNEALSNSLGEIDNAIEHVLIVPEELRLHPERRAHWEAVMDSVCAGLSSIPPGERSLALCLHWTFLRQVLPASPSADIIRNFSSKHALLDMADHFADQFHAMSESKEEIVRLLFRTFPDLPKSRAALEYISSITGTRQAPIP